MKKIFIKIAITIWVIWWLTLVTSCATSNPSARYARQHQYREFSSWDKIGKKMDKNAKSKPKEHARRNKY